MINFPTNYDSFFKNLKIIQELTKFQKIIKYFKNRKIPFNDSYVGFVYFAELLIIHLLLNIETLIQDEYLLERIRWGEVTLEDQDMQKTLKDHPEGKYILELNSIRRDLSKIRNSDGINEDLLEKKLVELNEKLSEIDHHIKEKYSVKKIVDDPEIEQKLVIENILLNYNYMRYDVSMFSKTNNNTPRYPGNLIFYLMPGEQKSNYYLTNPRIKSRNDDYLKGYITSLEFLYITFMPERSDYFRKIFSRIKNWLDLHQTFRKMYQDLDLENLTNKQQFEYNFEPIVTTIEKERIDDYSELRKVLRDRRTRLFDNFALDEGLLAHYFYGALSLIDQGATGENKTKLDIVEFKIDLPYERVVYFAIFHPDKGWISDGSHWLIFKDDSEISSSAEYLIEGSPEKYPDKIRLRKYTVQRDLVEKYLAEHTYGFEGIKHRNEMLKSSRNITSEMLALFYLMKVNRNNNIINFEFHKDIPGTDIDVLVETKNEIIIGQVKPYLSFNPDETKSILNNFYVISKSLIELLKPLKMFLFLMSREIPDSEFWFVVKDLPKGSDLTPLDGYIEERENQIIGEYTKNRINIIYLDEILEKFESDGNYGGMINQIKLIFNKKDVNPFEEESFRWGSF